MVGRRLLAISRLADAGLRLDYRLRAHGRASGMAGAAAVPGAAGDRDSAGVWPDRLAEPRTENRAKSSFVIRPWSLVVGPWSIVLARALASLRRDPPSLSAADAAGDGRAVEDRYAGTSAISA